MGPRDDLPSDRGQLIKIEKRSKENRTESQLSSFSRTRLKIDDIIERLV